jgi:heme-degrading monooxygenase HmoA
MEKAVNRGWIMNTLVGLFFMSPARTPDPPYYAVIFTSQRSEGERGYGAMAQRMMELVAQQPGFLGVESVRGEEGFGITVSYWESEEAIRNWKTNMEHAKAQEAGKRLWYADYQLRIARVEREYGGGTLRGATKD